MPRRKHGAKLFVTQIPVSIGKTGGELNGPLITDIDRAITDGDADGFVKIHTSRGRDEIVGATIVARNAGDLISEVSVAMAGRVGLGRLASVIHPYPTQADAIRQVANAYNRTRLTPTVKRLFEALMRLRR